MAEKKVKFANIEICPIRNVVARFSNKWAILIMLVLKEEGCLRFNQLRKFIPDISSKVLSSTLQILEADGLVKRTLYPEVPPRVEYELTAMGESLMPIIQDLTQWALRNMPTIIQQRERYDSQLKPNQPLFLWV